MGYCLAFVLTAAILMSETHSKCAFEAIFIFGDSNSDTGGFYAAFPSQPTPYGMTYFNKPTGRLSDGRLFVDFLAQGLGIPFTSPYLRSIGSDFRHGANFATSASTVLRLTGSQYANGFSPFYLAVQLNQMKQFKAKVEEFQSQGQTTNLPKSDVFGKSLYVVYIGQNDFTAYGISEGGIGGVNTIFPQMLSETLAAVKELYRLGGRNILVLNVGPLGCYPAVLVRCPHESSDLDSAGCIGFCNDAVDDYNRQLNAALEQTTGELGDADIVYVDTHSVIKELYQNLSAHGFEHGTTACCGYGGGPYNYDPRVLCGEYEEIDGETVAASACGDPENYVSWDGIHLTEAANKQIAYSILQGSVSYPDFPLNKYCDIQDSKLHSWRNNPVHFHNLNSVF